MKATTTWRLLSAVGLASLAASCWSDDTVSLPGGAPAGADPVDDPPAESVAAGDGAEPAGAFEPASAPPACDLVKRIFASPSIQIGDEQTSTIEVVLEDGVAAASVQWALSAGTGMQGTLQPSEQSELQATFDCQSDGELEIVATVNGSSDGKSCSEQARVGIECVAQTPAPRPAAAPEPSRPPAGPVGSCGQCSADNCAPQLAALDANPRATAPVLECVLGKDWAAGQRTAVTSCGNLDLFSCYCGSVSPFSCASSAPAALDGQCRDQILAGTSCTDSACVQTRLVNPASAAGQALRYVRCQQDFCYDFCFNP